MSRLADGAAWDGLVGGLPAPPGIYLVRGPRSVRPLRIVRLR